MRRLAIGLALAFELLVFGSAAANGRFPASRNVHIGGTSADTILVPTTFGLLISSDGGGSVRWVCEDALGYQGTYDPSHAVGPGGSLWMTSFDGIRVSRDAGCSWTAVGAPFDGLFPGDLTVDAAGRIWVVTAQSGATNGVYRNDDPASGDTFGPLHTDGALLTSVIVADSTPVRAYVGGFSFEMADPTPVLFRSIDDGATWEPLSVDSFPVTTTQLWIQAVSPLDPQILYVRVTMASGGDSLYRSADGGGSFSEVMSVSGTIETVLVRSSGVVVVGAGAEGMWLSSDGISFEQQDGAPQLSCAAETTGGLLYGCGANWLPDEFALATSSDAVTWAPVFRFQDIAGPLPCPAGTTQKDVCEDQRWPGLVEQLGIGAEDADAGADAGTGTDPKDDGCGCQSSGKTGALAVLLVLVGLLAGTRRFGRSR